jgi:hypothetical protein
MKIRVVPRTDVKVTKKSTSKFKPLLEALDKLEPGGNAIEVSFTSPKELNSMRNIVYSYSREKGIKIKTGKDATADRIFFYREK